MIDALWLIPAFIAGGAFVKYSCNWLHAQPAGPVRDTLLTIMNGGPGPLPK